MKKDIEGENDRSFTNDLIIAVSCKIRFRKYMVMTLSEIMKFLNRETNRIPFVSSNLFLNQYYLVGHILSILLLLEHLKTFPLELCILTTSKDISYYK